MTTKTHRLRTVAKIVGGGTPAASDDFWNGEVPFVTPPDLRGVHGAVCAVAERSLTRQGVEAGSRVVPAGSVVVSKRAPIGYVARLGMEAAFNQGCLALLPRAGIVESDFLTYAISVRSEEMQSLGQGTTFMEIPATSLADMAIQLPPLAEQRAIASYLDRETAEIDTLVEAQAGLIETLRERRAAVIEGSLGRPVTPLKAAAVVLDCLHVTAEFVDESPYPVASVRQVVGNSKVDLAEAKRTTRQFFERLRSEGRAPRTGDLLFIRNVSAGAVAEVGEDVEFAVGQETVIIRPRAGALSRYLLWTLKSAASQDQVRLASVGATFLRVNVPDVRNMRISLPALDEQRRIADYLDEKTAEIDALIAETERFIALAKERRAALITSAVTGQIDCTHLIEASDMEGALA